MSAGVFSAVTPELPVADVRAAQEHYRDRLGFEIAWYNEAGRIGAVSHGDRAVFLRETDASIAPVTLWVFAPDVAAAHAFSAANGALIVDPLAEKPWGLTQFTIRDLDGHLLHIFCD